MSEKQIIYYIKNESNSDLLYLVAVTCMERLVSLGKPNAIKAILDAGTTNLLKLMKK